MAHPIRAAGTRSESERRSGVLPILPEHKRIITVFPGELLAQQNRGGGMEGEKEKMRFSSLFRVIGKGSEVEVYRDNPGQYICSVTRNSRVPQEVYRSEVKSVAPFGLDRLIVIVGEEAKHEYKNQSFIQHGGRAGRSDPAAVSGGEVVEGKAEERTV